MLVSVRQALADYGRGPLTLLPAAVLLLVVQVFSDIGRWGPSQVLALSVAVSGSMLISNGFNQAMSRRGSICVSLGDLGAARKFLGVGMTVALGCTIVVAMLIIAVGSAIGVFTPAERFIFALVFVGLSVLWVIAGALSLLHAPGWLGIGMIAGLAAGLLANLSLMQSSPLSLAAGPLGNLIGSIIPKWVVPSFNEASYSVAVMTGFVSPGSLKRVALSDSAVRLALAGAIGFGVTLVVMLRALRRGFAKGPAGQPSRGALPPLAYLVHEAAPYFGYGSLYMAFIFLPHALGWFGSLGIRQDRMWAVSTLEIALTLALPPVIMVGGVAEHTLRLFWQQAKAGQEDTAGVEHLLFGKRLNRFYWQQLVRYLAVLGGLSIAAYLLFHLVFADMLPVSRPGFPAQNPAESVRTLGASFAQSWQTPPRLGPGPNSVAPGDSLSALRRALPKPDSMESIFDLSLIAYALLGWGVFNCMFVVTLARPQQALRAVVLAMIATVAVGVPLTFGLSFSYAVVAFAAGAMAFTVASFVATRNLLRSADYSYISSF